MSRPAVTVLAVVRAGWGLALLIAPAAVTSTVHHAPPGTRTRVVARVLGARHLAQAAVTAVRPTREVLRGGAVVDVLHASSMVALAVVSGPYRRAGLTDAAGGSAFALATRGVA